MTHSLLRFVAWMGACVLVAGVSLAADPAPSPFIGNWSLNVAKSKFEGTPPVKSYTLTITDAGGGKTHNRAEWVDSDGTKGQAEYTADPGGKPTPVAGYANADSVSVKSTGPRSLEMSLRKGGKEIEWGKYRVSADGKTLHGTEGGTDENGAKYRWLEVFERQ
jgi:hypothetical protein